MKRDKHAPCTWRQTRLINEKRAALGLPRLGLLSFRSTTVHAATNILNELNERLALAKTGNGTGCHNPQPHTTEAG
jgi:hypothetical protein